MKKTGLYISLLAMLFVSHALPSQVFFFGDDLLNQDVRVGTRDMAYNVPTYKFGFSLPILGQFQQEVFHSGFAYRDLVNGDGKVTYEKAIDRLKDINHVGFSTHETWMNFGFKIKKFWIRFSVEEQVDFRFDYPENLMKLIWFGNGAPEFLGQRVSLDGLGIQYMDRRNYVVGTSLVSPNEKWKFGANIRYIDGRNTIQTPKSRLGWTTDANDYSWEFDGEMRVVSSGIVNLGNISTDPKQLLKHALKPRGNFGFSIDVGASYNIDSKFTVAFNAADIGFIRWKRDILNYQTPDISLSFRGVNAKQLFGQDSLDNVYNQIVDSIPEVVTPQRDSARFTTFLAGTYQTLMYYEINPRHLVSFSITRVASFGTGFYTVYTGYRYEPVNRMGLTTGVGLSPSYGVSIGAGTCVHFGSLTFNAGTGNILSFIKPSSSRFASFQFGINFIFGRNEKRYR